MPKLPRLGRRQGGAGWLENRLEGGRRRTGPRERGHSKEKGLKRRLKYAKAIVVGVGVRGGWFVPFSSLARCEAWRVARPNLFGGGASRLPTREGCSPAPDGAPPIAAPAGRPKGRWILVRESSPYSSQLGRCSPLWRALRAIARQSGYPRFARLAIGRGAAAFGARQSLFKRLYSSAPPVIRNS